MNPFQIIKTVRVTEKGTTQGDRHNQFTVVADRRANKVQIRQAVQELFKVKVLRVNTLNVEGKLRRQRTDTLGYILPADKPQFADPFIAEFIAGLGDEAAANNFDLLVSTAPADSAQEKALYQRWVQGGKVDGLVLNYTRLRDWRIQYLAEQKKPFVSLERSFDEVDFVGVEVDPGEGYAELIDYLIGMGHSRIAYVGGPLGPTLRIDDAGAVAQAVNRLTVFVVVRADSHEAAARLFDGHPHMTIFPSDGVEVMPVLGD